MERRDFIKTGGRVLILIIIGVFTAVGLKQNKITSTTACSKTNFCSNCNKLSYCSLPQATKYQKDGRR